VQNAPNNQCDPSDPDVSNSSCTTQRTPLDFPLARKHRIDAEVTVKGATPEVRSGVKFGDGDGTIPVISLGAMCVRGWNGRTAWNPAGMKVVTQGELRGCLEV
jgi:phospholipid:diacylglycerol acyltransferase